MFAENWSIILLPEWFKELVRALIRRKKRSSALNPLPFATRNYKRY